MGAYYVTDMLDVLRDAGCAVGENATTDGWQHRARGSGGFNAAPLGIQWHHTASSTSPANDLSWMIDGCDDAPIGNVLLDRTGVFWPVAAGASNTAGKGGPLTLSRGTVPVDSGNSTTFAIEAANGGTGETWPAVQIDAYLAGSNALNARFGNVPGDVFTHQVWAPSRKIDPATATAVQGVWRPGSVTSSGTWSLDDIRAECSRRAGTPPPPEDDLTPEQAQQLADLWNTHAANLPGNLDPNGDEMNSAWTAVYGYRLGQDIQRRLWAIEDALHIPHT
jgi:hypothetical protein